MLLTKILSTAVTVAVAVSGMAASPPSVVREAENALEARNGGHSCPVERPHYCGWWDKGEDEPPCCKPTTNKPDPMPKPSCPSGHTAYCAKDPGHFHPYDKNHEYCQGNGLHWCGCFDICDKAHDIEIFLSSHFCPEDKAWNKLGDDCVANGHCDAHGGYSSWTECPDLGTTVAELVAFTVDGVVEVVTDLLCLLGGILRREE